MKNLYRLMLAMLLLISYSNANAQDKNNPWKITLGVNAVDAYPSGEGTLSAGGGFTGESFGEEFLNAEDHWNILPSLSTLVVSKYLCSGFSLGITGSLNKIDKWGDISK